MSTTTPPPIITTITGSCLGDVLTITVSDNTPSGRANQTWRLTKNGDSSWTLPPDLSKDTGELLTAFAARMDGLK